MRIVVAYKWTCDPQEATVRADGTVDWSRAKPGLSTYDPVAMELARQLAEEAGAELIGVTVGGKGVGAPLASKAALGRGLDRVVIVEDESLRESRPVRARRGARRGDPPYRRRGPGHHRRLVGRRGGQDGADRAGRRARLAGRGRGHGGDGNAVQAGARRVERAIPGGVQVLEIAGPAVLAASADAAVPRVPGMKELLAAAKKPVELLELAALKVPQQNAVMTVAGRARPERKARKGQLIDTADPAAAAAELVAALRAAGTL